MSSEMLEGWEVASSPPGACAEPRDLAALDWVPARVPGTAAAAVGADGRDFDAEDWWFRTRFQSAAPGPDEQITLELDGIATIAEVFLNGRLVHESASMWARHRLDVTTVLGAENELAIACRALAPRLKEPRRPRARWRTRVVSDGNLRWFRTMVFGRSPGFAPGPAPVGPWRPVRLHRHSGVRLQHLALRPRLEGDDGVLMISARLSAPAGPVQAALGEASVSLSPAADGALTGELRVAGVARWWPHTHGDPVLHEVAVSVGGRELARRRVGFRELRWRGDPEQDGLDLCINGVAVFVRGAVWTPPELVTMAPSSALLRKLLELVRDAGMNMVRVVGTGAYESATFHDLCDELGILVWQDFMFANLDYPTGDPEFRATVEAEVEQVLEALAGRPSLAVVAGNSEVEQQPAMLGLDPGLGRDSLWEEVMPRLVRDAGADAAFLRSTPVGGELPFHADRGTVHYFGVSGYFGELQDARRAGVRFAAESLAFANVPDVVEVPVHHPRWKAGVQRDAGSGWGGGAGWDFDDVRDFYLGRLHGVDPVQLRRSDHDRYLELSRAVSGEVMAEVMGEWRRPASPCTGALVLWLKDMQPGAGLGVLDHSGRPKLAYYHLRRALSPVAVWSTDEGVNGVAIHVANDRPQPLAGLLRVALYRGLEDLTDEARTQLELPGHGSVTLSLEALLGHFVDAAWAYRFGPPAQDAIVVSLESEGDPPKLLSQAIRFPAGRPKQRHGAGQIGLEAAVTQLSGGSLSLELSCRRLAYGVRIDVPGFVAADDGFSIEPGSGRIVELSATEEGSEFTGGTVTALNLIGHAKIASQP